MKSVTRKSKKSSVVYLKGLSSDLFSSYDMCKVSELLKLIIFADDTDIFCIDDDPKVLIDKLNNELIKLTKWFRVNKLSLNVSKSNYMVFVIDKFLVLTR